MRRRLRHDRWRPLAGLFAGCCAAFIATAQPAPERASGWTEKAPVTTRQWMVAAANPLAAQAGNSILARGGSAVDAAIAVQLVLGLVEPQSSGLWWRVDDARP